MDTAETATYLGVPAKTLAVWRVSKPRRGPEFVKIGRHVRYRRDDLDAFIDACRVVQDEGGQA
ncbi:MAG: helix-turn-helix domain-containing protein [Propionibacteriaceae bacterium]|nr:helix-turn-helix domain-containing protein [Propionibacteriaceae bacterium]